MGIYDASCLYMPTYLKEICMSVISKLEELIYLIDPYTAATTIGIIDKYNNIEEFANAPEEVVVVRPSFPIEYQPTQASLYITSQCNFNCEYCYIKNQYNDNQAFLNNDEWELVISQLYDSGIRKLSFLGGEPFLYPYLSELLQYADNLNFIGIEISTNGSIEMLQKNYFALKTLNNLNAHTSISVSLDSTDEHYHDKIRGGYSSVIEGIQLLVKMGFTISLASVLTEQNKNEIPEMVSLGVSLGAKAFQFNGLIPMTDEQKALVIRDNITLNLLSQQIDEIQKKYNGRIKLINRLLPQSCLTPDLLRKYSNNEIVCNCSLVGCPAGRREVYILPNGALVPCPMFIRDVSFHSIWRLTKSSFSEIWNETASLISFRERLLDHIPTACYKCEFKGLCRGGCPALSNYINDDFYAPDPRCPIKKG